MKLYLFLILSITTIFASNACVEEGSVIGRNPENCQHHFKCIGGQKVDFWCPNGEIFDLDRRVCRPGDSRSCKFSIVQIPVDACQNDFFTINPHPDRFECQRFFVCMNYNMVPFECDPGTIFGLERLSCIEGNVQGCV